MRDPTGGKSTICKRFPWTASKITMCPSHFGLAGGDMEVCASFCLSVFLCPPILRLGDIRSHFERHWTTPNPPLPQYEWLSPADAQRSGQILTLKKMYYPKCQ